MSHERQASASNEIRTKRALPLIRGATLHDIAAILQLERGCETAAHWSEEQYREAIEQADHLPERFVVVAEIDDSLVRASNAKIPALSPQEARRRGTPVGFLVARRAEREWELENIAVAPKFRGQGIGRQLLDGLLAHAKEAKNAAIFLEVRESNAAARTLYERAGFRQNGRRKLYYSDPAEDAVLYSREL